MTLANPATTSTHKTPVAGVRPALSVCSSRTGSATYSNCATGIPRRRVAHRGRIVLDAARYEATAHTVRSRSISREFHGCTLAKKFYQGLTQPVWGFTQPMWGDT